MSIESKIILIAASLALGALLAVLLLRFKNRK